MKWYKSKVGITLIIIYLVVSGILIALSILADTLYPGTEGGPFGFLQYVSLLLLLPSLFITLFIPTRGIFSAQFMTGVTILLNASLYYIGYSIETRRKNGMAIREPTKPNRGEG